MLLKSLYNPGIFRILTQLTFDCSNLTIETLKKGVEYL